MIESTCRTYLWTSNNLSSKKALISWEKLCTPKVAGGQNIINMALWNQAAIVGSNRREGKLVDKMVAGILYERAICGTMLHPDECYLGVEKDY
ncbi:hypothetical protein RDI58_000621 [Solanum bulbocastanum]|uniref:Uncharacterized protein n=1 Tax=Solanum bulbocastanum TaxID=147425 RepID=A0AAN8U1M4_SOLBU